VSLQGLRILFAGSGEFGVPSLARLIDHGAAVARVYTQPDKPAGRGHKLTPTPVGQFALSRGLDLVRTDDINAEPLPPADLMVVIAFGQKLAPHVVDHARLGAINLHASRLPAYRGAAPINWAVIRGESETGNSVIRLAQRMDAGAVLAMSRLGIGPLETAGEVHDRLSLDGANLVERVALELMQGSARPIEQDHTHATKAPKLSRDASRIDWNQPGWVIAHQIRGMYPWPGCRVKLLDGTTEIDRVTLVRARQGPGEWPTENGTIRPDGLIEATAASVEIVELQPEGKKPMTLIDYRNGHRWDAGMRIQSC
jgi:methionyl-tRNA formyltransferase